MDAQGRVTAASSGTPVDADKIIEGNTEVEAVDTGSDGHIKVTTEGSERLRVGPAGQVGIGGANYGTSGQVLMSGGASAAPTWGNVSSGGSFEATASGAIADGDMLNLNSDGTVEAIGESQVSFATGKAEVVNHEMEDAGSVCWIQGTNKFIVVYNDPTNNFYNNSSWYCKWYNYHLWNPVCLLQF